MYKCVCVCVYFLSVCVVHLCILFEPVRDYLFSLKKRKIRKINFAHRCKQPQNDTSYDFSFIYFVQEKKKEYKMKPKKQKPNETINKIREKKRIAMMSV